MLRLVTLFTCLLLVSPEARSAGEFLKPEFFTVTPSDMWAYWLLFLMPVGLAFSPFKVDKNLDNIVWAIVGLLSILLIGLRYDVGGDWDNYLMILDLARSADFNVDDAFRVSFGNALGYMLINRIGLQLGGDIYFVNTFCATIFIVGLIKYSRKQPYPWIALAVAIPYMVCAVAMGYTRQSAAIGFLLWGLSILRPGNELKYVGLLVLGFFFHQSVIVTLPLILFARKKILWYFYPLSVMFLVGFIYLITSVQNQGMTVIERYLIIWEYTATRQSAGGAIRTYLNALPVFASLFFWNRIKMISTDDYRIIKWMSIACVLAIPALAIGPTLVDRLGLYLMPMQIALWPRLIAVQRTSLERSIWASMISAFYGLVLFIFFHYGVHAHFWLPYRMWPFSSEPIYALPMPY